TRGVNLSDKPAALEAYHLDRLVEDAAGLIAALGHESAVVVGHDWGGFIAWMLAIRRPELVERLVIINCAHPHAFERLLREHPGQRQASQYMLAFRSERGEELLSRDDFAGFRHNILEPGLTGGY